MSDHDRRAIRGSAWIAAGSGGSQLVWFLITILLARLLTPAAFGTVALASIPLFFLTYLQESGLGAAVIRARTDVQAAAATQLIFGLIFSALLYGVTFVSAPWIAHAFSQPQLTTLLRVLSIVLVIRALSAPPAALIERELSFVDRAKGELAGSGAQAIVAVSLAFAGAGVWSLVGGQLANASLQGLVWWLVSPLKPSPRHASWRKFRELARFGRHVTLGNVVGLVVDNADNIVIGRLLGAVSVGYYNMAWRLANLPAIEVSYVIGRVAFPLYSTMQDDLDAFREVFLATLRRMTFICIPIAFGILCAAHPIVVGIYGEKWRAAVGPLQILAIFAIVRTFAGATAPVFQASGHPQYNYLIGLFHAAVLFPLLLLLAPDHGIVGVAIAEALAALAFGLPCYVLVKRILAISGSELLSNLAKPFYCTAAVTAAVLATRVGTGSLTAGTQLAVIAAAGTAVYLASMLTFGRSELRTIIAAFRGTPTSEQV